MDASRASRLQEALTGRSVSGWQIGELIGFGGSAAVFSGVRGEREAAVKIIDPDLVAEFGEERQRRRIDTEAMLVSHGHPNLVAVYETGKCVDTGHLFVVMERLRYRTLTERIADLPPEVVGLIIEQISSAARWLDEREICHQDIKPDNIMVAEDWSRAVLMDLGIILPFGEGQEGGQDPSGERFIGTARYCPPEFVRNRMQKDAEGYRAVTFYQLGAILHDMILRSRIFDQVRGPYAVLLDAIDREIPVVSSEVVPQHLVFLARDCLVKNAEHRIALVNWDRFSRAAPSASESARERVDTAYRQAGGNRQMKVSSTAGISRTSLERLGRHFRSQISAVCDADPRLLRPSVDVNVLIGSVEANADFEAAPERDIMRTFRIRFEATPIDADVGTFALYGEPRWLDEPVEQQEIERHRVGVVRGPEDDLTTEFSDFLFRTMAAAMGQPKGMQAKLKLDN